MIKIDDIENFKNKMVSPDGTFLTSDRNKLLKLIKDFLEQNIYDNNDIQKINRYYYSYCISGLRNEIVNITDNKLTISNIKFKDEIIFLDYYKIYEKLLIIDKKRKSLLWNERSLYLLNFFEIGQNFLADNKYNKLKLEDICWEKLNKDLISNEDILNNNYEIKLEKVKKLCPNLIKKITWSKKEMNNNLYLILSKESNYQLNQKQLVEYFEFIKPSIIRINKNNIEQIDKYVNFYTDILMESSFFKFNISKWKDLKNGLGKFLNTNMTSVKNFSEELTSVEKFIFLLSNHPKLKQENMKVKLENGDKLKIFGKINLNEEDNSLYEQMKNEKEKIAKVKKNKI